MPGRSGKRRRRIWPRRRKGAAPRSCQVETTPWPPGRVTRAISERPLRQSGNMITPKIEKTASKPASGRARAWPSITWASTLGRPAAARRRQRRGAGAGRHVEDAAVGRQGEAREGRLGVAGGEGVGGPFVMQGGGVQVVRVFELAHRRG